MPPAPRPEEQATVGALACPPRTVVLLISWMGASRRALQRYVDMHEGRGGKVPGDILVLPVCVSVAATFLKAPQAEVWQKVLHGQNPAAKALRDAGLLQASNSGQQPSEPVPEIVIHLFSNGGVIMLHALQRLYPALFNKSRVRAMVWDSAPGDLTLSLGFKAIAQSMPNMKRGMYCAAAGCSLVLLRWISRQRLRTTMLQALLFLTLRWFFRTFLNPSQRYHNRIIADKLRPPTLFMYSGADQLVSSHVVERIIRGRRTQGVNVHVKRWEDSPHVAHGKKHEEEYKDVLNGFLDKVQ